MRASLPGLFEGLPQWESSHAWNDGYAACASATIVEAWRARDFECLAANVAKCAMGDRWSSSWLIASYGPWPLASSHR